MVPLYLQFHILGFVNCRLCSTVVFTLEKKICEKNQCLRIVVLVALEHKHFLTQERQKDHQPQRLEIANPVNQKPLS